MLVPLEKPNFSVRFATVNIPGATLKTGELDINDIRKVVKNIAIAHYNFYKKLWDDAYKAWEKCTTESEMYNKFARYSIPEPSAKCDEIKNYLEREINAQIKKRIKEHIDTDKVKDELLRIRPIIMQIEDAYMAVALGIRKGLGENKEFDRIRPNTDLKHLKQGIDRI